MNNTRDVRDIFKEAVGSQGRNFVRGTTHKDAHMFLRHVTSLHYHTSGLMLRYDFKKLGFNKEWDMNYLYKNLCTKGKYVLFGATHKNNAAHHTIIKNVHSESTDEDKIDTWIKAKEALNNHAIGISVDENMIGTIYDNGCRKGFNEFSFNNLCSRMRWINAMYKIDIKLVK